MLDIKLLRDELPRVKENIARRKDKKALKLLEDAVELDNKWRQTLRKADELRSQRNRLAVQLSEKNLDPKTKEKLIRESSAISEEIVSLEKAVEDTRQRLDAALLRLPNLLHDSVPFGKDESENVEVRRWGAVPAPSKWLKPHGDVGESLGVLDFERARKTAGAGFIYASGHLVLLDLALQQFALDFLVQSGFVPILPPFMMRRRPYEGVTDLADFENVMYKVEDEDLYLIATSEHPIAAMYMDEIIDEDLLPLKYAGVSTNFRKEIGGHGVDTKGLFRMHQFNKVEQFIFCRPEDSWKIHEELIRNAEDIFKALEIPHRVVSVCTGDIGTVAAKKYDLEAWFPRQNNYGEVISCSNCTDYQARRLNIRAGKAGGRKFVPHTLNSTAIATSRALVAIMENYQNEDGTVTVPKALRPYMKGIESIGPTKRRSA